MLLRAYTRMRPWKLFSTNSKTNKARRRKRRALLFPPPTRIPPMSKVFQIPHKGKESLSQIGGVMDYRVLARLHRPTDPAALNAELSRLRATGLTPADISVALGLALPAVHEGLRGEG